jgi:hypothetical protein
LQLQGDIVNCEFPLLFPCSDNGISLIMWIDS